MLRAMIVALLSSPACADHDPGPGHPECPARLQAALDALGGAEFAPLRRLDAAAATSAQLERAHSPRYVRRILSILPEVGDAVRLDPDTVMSRGSAEAARRAAGAACAAVDAVMGGTAGAAFAAIRPPGHHAEPAQAMGFCLFGSAAVAAFHARDRWGLRRIAIADFDVHHGNGTQAIMQSDPDLFFASSHQSPCFPGTGAASERGVAGNVANLPLAPGTGGAGFRAGWTERLLPALDRFAPELLIVSAGFDAHRDDPLAQLELDEDDFVWITERLQALAARHCGGRLVSLLEGGYDLPALGRCVAAHVRTLMRTAAASDV